jgi:caffeoyl-CoA O-methyltransferase
MVTASSTIHRILLLLTIPALLAATSTPRAAADDAPATAADSSAADSNAMREAFIRDFRRIGLNTTPGDAQLLRVLVATAGSTRGVEVGTATGYGAIHMGLAFEHTGGKLITIDIDPKMVAAARNNLQQVQLQDTVTVVEGDALKVLPQLEGEYDFLFLDAVKQDYLRYLQAMEPKMKAGSLIVADNVIRSANAMRDFLEYVEQSPSYQMAIVRASLDKDDGMAIIYKLK